MVIVVNKVTQGSRIKCVWPLSLPHSLRVEFLTGWKHAGCTDPAEDEEWCRGSSCSMTETADCHRRRVGNRAFFHVNDIHIRQNIASILIAPSRHVEPPYLGNWTFIFNGTSTRVSSMYTTWFKQICKHFRVGWWKRKCVLPTLEECVAAAEPIRNGFANGVTANMKLVYRA